MLQGSRWGSGHDGVTKTGAGKGSFWDWKGGGEAGRFPGRGGQDVLLEGMD